MNSVVSGNNSGNDGGGLSAQLTYSSLAVEDSVVSGNTAASDGGGVFAFASASFSNPFPTPRAITISRSLVSGNTASIRGGGIFTLNYSGTETLVEQSQVTGNHALSTFGISNGGGIYAYVYDYSGGGLHKPKFTITESTVDNNDTEHEGGGIFVCSKHFGNFVAINSTFSNNRTTSQSTDPMLIGRGGGIFIAHYPIETESVDAYLQNITVTQNVSASGGGVEMASLDNVRVRIANSIISQNYSDTAKTIPNNLVGRLDIANTKYNLVGSGSTILNLSGGSASLDSTNLNSTNLALNNAPQLGVLADNGGFAPTHRPLVGSPAIDAGDPIYTPSNFPVVNGMPLTTDQRGTGFTRVFDAIPGGAQIDIGAYEIGLAKVTNVTISGSTSTHDPYSFNGPNDALDFDGSGLQLRTVQVGGADTVSIQLSESASNLVSGSLTIRGLKTYVTPTLAMGGYSFDPNTNTATWRFNAPFIADQYQLCLTDAVVDSFGRQLDGDWMNPFSVETINPLVSEFPSGNGIAGGKFTFVYTILPGDIDLTNTVTGRDFLFLQQNYVGSDHIFIAGDFNGDGLTNTADLAFWQTNFDLDLNLSELIYADFNGDGIANYADYVILQSHMGSTSAIFSDGDVNNDGCVTYLDNTIWQLQYGLQIACVA